MTPPAMGADFKHLLLRQKADPADVWLCDQLSRQIPSLYVASIDDLIDATYMHWVSKAGAGWSAVFPDGSAVKSSTLRSAIVLPQAVPAASVDHVAGKDRKYAYQEISAAMCSMLACIKGPVVNRPMPLSLSGQQRSVACWMAKAHSAQLATQYVDDKTISDDPVDGETTTVSVIGDHVFSSLSMPRNVEAGLKRLGQSLPELAFSTKFNVAKDRWVFMSGASSLEMRQDKRMVDALVGLVVRS